VNPLVRRLAALEVHLSAKGAALREGEAAEIVAAGLREAGCAATASANRAVVVVEEGGDPTEAERLESKLYSLACASRAFAAVPVVVLTRLTPIEEGGNVASWVEVGSDEIVMNATEVTRGTVADLAGGSNPRALRSPTTQEES
jgi:hypothetical protein